MRMWDVVIDRSLHNIDLHTMHENTLEHQQIVPLTLCH